MFRFAIYCSLTFIACMFHLTGTYYFLHAAMHKTFLAILATSISLNAVATIIRVPANMYLGEGLTLVYMEMLYVFLLFLATMIYSVFILHEQVELHTYIIAGLIFGLFIMNKQLSMKLRN